MSSDFIYFHVRYKTECRYSFFGTKVAWYLHAQKAIYNSLCAEVNNITKNYSLENSCNKTQ